MINFSDYIDILTYFESQLGSAKLTGRQAYFICSFHQEKTASLSVNIDTGQYYCFGCGEHGNIVSFTQKKLGLESTKEAYKYLCKYANIPFNDVNHKNALEIYSSLKQLPLHFLLDLGIRHDYNELIIPYRDQTNNFVRNRIRNIKTSLKKWDNAIDTPTCLYGLWLLPTFNTDYAILVEGESDTQTLIFNNFPVLGVPGACFFKKEWVASINHLEELYLFIEPDSSGEKFLEITTHQLREGNYNGKVYAFSFKTYKDPSDAWCAMHNADTFKEYVQQHLDSATLIDIKTGQEKSITFSPLALKGINQFDVTKKGVLKIIKKDDGSLHESKITSTPLVISNRVKELDGHLEQVEISYFLDNSWHTSVQMRSELFNTRNIVKLADLGINVSSLNAKELVYFFQTLESSNRDRFPIKKVINTLGWHNNIFVPYGDDNITVVQEDELKKLWKAFSVKGSLLENIDYMYSIINDHALVRLYVMASLASPFFKDLGQRIMCIYIWAQSKSGKTAALQLALSVWGIPSRLMKNFNATACGIEEIANMLNNLPLGLNERQQKIYDKSSQQLIESLIYMLAEGTGRSKSTKYGGVKSVTEWHNVVLANGEIPLLADHSHEGARNRCLEIYGKPFDDEELARSVYKNVEHIHGALGYELVTKVLMSQNYAFLLDTLKKEIRDIESLLINEYPYKNTTHLSLISTIFAVDYQLTHFTFKPQYILPKEAILSMYKKIITMLPNVIEYDLTESFYQTTQDWLSSNHTHFASNTYMPSGKLLGLVEATNTIISYFVYQEALRELCDLKSVNYKQILESFAKKGYIKTQESNGKGRRTVRKTLNGLQQSFIQFNLNTTTQGEL